MVEAPLMSVLVLVADTETGEGFEVVDDCGLLDELDDIWVEELGVVELEIGDEELRAIELLDPMLVLDEATVDELDEEVDPTIGGVGDDDPESGSPRARIELSSAEYTVPLPN